MGKTDVVRWGKNHKKYFKDYEEARNFAYNKAFYFHTTLNGIEFKRAF